MIDCRICGCTDEEACITEEGPCYWVEEDLCSACAEDRGEEATMIDFEFTDDQGHRYRVKTWGEDPWLFHWYESYQDWVSFRRVTAGEVEMFRMKSNEEQSRKARA